MTDHRKDAETRVEQADREAAAEAVFRRTILAHYGVEQPWMDAATTAMRLGEQDHHAEVQAFARHAAAAYQRGLADAGVENKAALREAVDLATTLHRRYYRTVTQWKPLDTVPGVISQIDNMIAGICSMLDEARSTPPTSEPMVSREAAADLALTIGPVFTSAYSRDALWGYNQAREQIAAAIRNMRPATPIQERTDG